MAPLSAVLLIEQSGGGEGGEGGREGEGISYLEGGAESLLEIRAEIVVGTQSLFLEERRRDGDGLEFVFRQRQ